MEKAVVIRSRCQLAQRQMIAVRDTEILFEKKMKLLE